MQPDDIHNIKLKTDSIREALLEIRFDSAFPYELVLGRLSELSEIGQFSFNRLPIAEMPLQLRQIDENLRYQPSLELRDISDPTWMIRVGGNSISCHQLQPYAGWEKFHPRVLQVIDHLFSKLMNVTIRRIGLRYLNTLNNHEHKISTIHDLSIIAKIGSESLPSFSLTYRRNSSKDHLNQVVIATPDFVNIPDGSIFSALIDIDVSSSPNLIFTEKSDVRNWVDRAHSELKNEYFQIIPKRMIEELRRVS